MYMRLTGDRSSGKKGTSNIWSLPIQMQNPLANPACRRGDDGLGHTCRKSWQQGLSERKFFSVSPVMIKNQYLSLRRPHRTRSADRPPWLSLPRRLPRSWTGGTGATIGARVRRINYKSTIYRTPRPINSSSSTADEIRVKKMTPPRARPSHAAFAHARAASTLFCTEFDRTNGAKAAKGGERIYVTRERRRRREWSLI